MGNECAGGMTAEDNVAGIRHPHDVVGRGSSSDGQRLCDIWARRVVCFCGVTSRAFLELYGEEGGRARSPPAPDPPMSSPSQHLRPTSLLRTEVCLRQEAAWGRGSLSEKGGATNPTNLTEVAYPVRGSLEGV